MKKNFLKKLALSLSLGVAIACPVIFSGCDLSSTVSVVGIAKTSTQGLVDTYTITYSNGTTSTFTITNGQDATSPTIQEIYAEYVNQYGQISYADFLKMYLGSSDDNSVVINECLQSALKIYTEFKITSGYGWGYTQQKSLAVYCGSGVIYQINQDYTYIITNYHVVYNASTNSDNGGNIACGIWGYVYGSEGSPTKTGSSDGYDVYSYGNYGIQFTYVGGSAEQDIAVLRTQTSAIKAINENIKAVEFADEYHTGETAIAIGNPENEGISATEGIVSVDNEFIALSVGSVTRTYRSIRMDTSIYGGSSGGGLFNKDGKLIGITNAGDNTDENINFAIPVQIVKNTAENIMRNYNGTDATTVKKITIGITVSGQNSKYVYDATKGYGQIVESVVITEVKDSSIAKEIGLEADDTLTAIIVNGTEYNLTRYFQIGDWTLAIKTGDTLAFKYTRGGQANQTLTHTVLATEVK